MFAKFFFRIIVGFFVVAIISLITGLGSSKIITDSLNAILLIIFCTGGIGILLIPLLILPLIPFAYFIGLITTIWFIPFGRGPWNSKDRVAYKKEIDHQKYIRSKIANQTGVPNGSNLPDWNKATPIHSNSVLIIANYISTALKKGLSAAEIRQNLEKAGWSKSAIEFAGKGILYN